MKTIYSLRLFIVLFLGLLFSERVHATIWIIQVSNFVFTPASLPDVAVGDTLHWVWVSGSHTTTSATIPSGAASWDQVISSGHTTFNYKVTVAGTYDYVCTPHATMGMTGSFVATAPAPTLNVAPPSQSVAYQSGSVDFTVTSNSGWTASSDAGWCTVTPSGTGNGILHASFTENGTNVQRTATITVTVTGLSPLTVTVVQDGTTLSVQEIKNDPVRIFPNPTKGPVMIRISPDTRITGVTILDLTGKTVLNPIVGNDKVVNLDLSDLKDGFYFIEISTDQGNFSRRLVLDK